MRASLFSTLLAPSLVLAVPAPLAHPISDVTAHVARQAPDDCAGYDASNVQKTDSGLTADLTLVGTGCNVYSEDMKELKLVVEYQTNDRLHVNIYDAGLNQFQVQEDILPRPKNENAKAADAALEFAIKEKPFSFSVKRKENNEVLFDTDGFNLIFESQYLRLRTKLPDNPNLYGMGEHSDSFRMGTNGYQRTFWNAESPFIPTNSNLYGTHPVYFDHRGDKGTHGVFLLNSNGMDVNIDKTNEGQQYLEYNTLGGVFDFYFLAGKKPADVSKQYADVVGYSAMYPYWTFGFQQCRYGYWDVNMVAEVVANYSTAGIPLEVMWTDIDYMDRRRDFTADKQRFEMSKYRELVDTLHKRDQRYILILDPAIPNTNEDYGTYDRGIDADVFFKNEDGSPYLGVQWPGVVAWPDWFAPKTEEWWSDEISRFFSAETGIDIDGIWVDMNEASNFCPDYKCNPYDHARNAGIPPENKNPPRPNTGRPIPGFPESFQPGSNPSIKARDASAIEAPKAPSVKARDVDMVAPRQIQHELGKMKGMPDRELLEPKYEINNHGGNPIGYFTIFTNNTNYDATKQYDTHNFYGHMMAHTTHTSMVKRRPGKRPFVMTRSTFAGSGRKVTHWFGDNESSWEHYRTSIRQMLAFVSMHQMPMVGSDICGFNGKADEFMCARWALLGAFQPFYRNHAEFSTPDQEYYRWPLVTEAGKKAIDVRYRLMDYAYTALYYQTTEGTPMINPLFFLYPNDANTFGLQEQWFYGDALLISPVTTDFSDTVTFYLPKDTFYDYWTHALVTGEGKNVTKSEVAYTDIPVHIRGGTIIPERVKSADTTKLLRQEDFVIIVAPNSESKATGRLYLDDGESIEQQSTSEIKFSFDNGKFSATGSFAYGGNNGESVTVSKVIVLGQNKAGSNGKFNEEKKEIEVEGPWKLGGDFGFDL